MKCVAVQWSLNLVVFGKFYACSNFPDCRHTQAIVKEIGVECQAVSQGQIIERKPNAIASSMVAIAIQNVNLPLGTSLLVVTVQNVATSLWRKKSVVVASRLFVARVTTRKKRLNKSRVLKVNFRLFLVGA